MEEKKIKLKPKESSEGQEKMSYEKLNEVCCNLSQQNQQMQEYIKRLHTQIQDMGTVIQSKRLDYLFKVVELTDTIKDADFVNSCISEIKSALIEESEKENHGSN